ncbi:hypothetical protein FJZ41_02685 [Candidatus Shapirobacteria bacterium]|nr:hypothetical protein [Candidatus Shapirobacteria bacterium]
METPMGWNAYEDYGDTLPDESLKKATKIGILFFGGVGDPLYDKEIGQKNPGMMPEARCLLNIRNEWGLLINCRPFIYYKQLSHLTKIKGEYIPQQGVSQIFMRFLLEDSYFGNKDLSEEAEFNYPDYDVFNSYGIKRDKREVTGNEEIITDLAYYRIETLEKYFNYVFRYARAANLPVIAIDKANVIPRYVFWRKVCQKIHQELYSDINLTHLYVDAANALLFTPTKLHGVIACGNEHGDILSDGAAEAYGSLGLMHSSAINPENGMAMFESGAGTAADKAGKNIVNPLGRILTAALMLKHIGVVKGSATIEEIVNELLLEGWRTEDLYNSTLDDKKLLVGTKEMGELVLQRIANGFI